MQKQLVDKSEFISLPPGGRWIFAMPKHRKKTEGESRNVEFAVALCYAILPQSASQTAPSRREPHFQTPIYPNLCCFNLLFGSLCDKI